MAASPPVLDFGISQVWNAKAGRRKLGIDAIESRITSLQQEIANFPTKAGAQGNQGTQGNQGFQGTTGSLGLQGPQGIAGGGGSSAYASLAKYGGF